MKSFELGKVTKTKVLIFDMDETLISARFESRMIDGFQTSFTFDYHGQPIHVRTRPYL
jgi:FMN phosphatase YigB (HAD superfamily)